MDIDVMQRTLTRVKAEVAALYAAGAHELHARVAEVEASIESLNAKIRDLAQAVEEKLAPPPAAEPAAAPPTEAAPEAPARKAKATSGDAAD